MAKDFTIIFTQLQARNPKDRLVFFEAEPLIENVSDADIGLDYAITPEKVYTFTPLRDPKQ